MNTKIPLCADHMPAEPHPDCGYELSTKAKCIDCARANQLLEGFLQSAMRKLS